MDIQEVVRCDTSRKGETQRFSPFQAENSQSTVSSAHTGHLGGDAKTEQKKNIVQFMPGIRCRGKSGALV